MFSAQARTIFQQIKAANNILLIPHQQPDGDALGAVTALAELCTTLGKPFQIFCHTPASDRFDYLEHIEHLTSDTAVWQKPQWDLIIVCDSGDLGYAGVDKHIDALAKKITLINIDHHVSNSRYGDFKLVVDTASSTCEVLYHFFTVNHVPINQAMAVSLLTGVMYDTDNFTNGATSQTALAIGSDLVRRGADLSFVRHVLFQNKSIASLHVWGAVLARLTKIPELDLTYTYITSEDLRAHALDQKDAEGIANFLSTLGETDMTMFLKENADGQIKGSFRTTHDTHDVSLMAKQFGGGGHKKAAGFTVAGPMEEGIQFILKTLQEHKQQ